MTAPPDRRTVLVGAMAALAGLSAGVAACSVRPEPDSSPSVSPAPTPPKHIRRLKVRVANQVSRSRDDLVFGLETLDDDTAVESVEDSSGGVLRAFSLDNDRTLRTAALPQAGVGQGLARIGSVLYQGVRDQNQIHLWSLPELTHRGTVEIEGQALGLCYDSQNNLLWRSDGGPTLYPHDPDTMELAGHPLLVLAGQNPAGPLGELAFAGGSIWAVRHRTDRIVQIDTTEGFVRSEVDASSLRHLAHDEGLDLTDGTAVLSGLNVDPASGSLLITGARWPVMFNVSPVEQHDRD